MRKFFLLFGLTGLFLNGFTGNGSENGIRLSAAPRDVQIKIHLNQTLYKKGTPIGVAILIYSGANTSLTFPSSRIYDLILETEGKKVWQWSAGRMFTQSLIMKELKPDEPLLYCEVIDPLALKLNLRPGEYILTPVLCLKEPITGTPAHFVIK